MIAIRALAPVPESDLDRLARAIQAEHDAVESALGLAVTHAIRAGELLTAAKAEVGHGAWRDWLDANVVFTQQTAATYMRLHRRRDQIESARSIRAAVAELAEAKSPKTDLRAMWAKLERVIATRPMTTYKPGRQTLGRQLAWHETEVKRLERELSELDGETRHVESGRSPGGRCYSAVSRRACPGTTLSTR